MFSNIVSILFILSIASTGTWVLVHFAWRYFQSWVPSAWKSFEYTADAFPVLEFYPLVRVFPKSETIFELKGSLSCRLSFLNSSKNLFISLLLWFRTINWDLKREWSSAAPTATISNIPRPIMIEGWLLKIPTITRSSPNVTHPISRKARLHAPR